MKLTGTFLYLGIEKFHSFSKNQDYSSACFLQGTDLQKVFLNDDNKHFVKDIPDNTPVIVEFDVKGGKDVFISLLSVNPVAVSEQKFDESSEQKPADLPKQKSA